jgi:hypothetical protein
MVVVVVLFIALALGVFDPPEKPKVNPPRGGPVPPGPPMGDDAPRGTDGPEGTVSRTGVGSEGVERLPPDKSGIFENCSLISATPLFGDWLTCTYQCEYKQIERLAKSKCPPIETIPV